MASGEIRRGAKDGRSEVTAKATYDSILPIRNIQLVATLLALAHIAHPHNYKHSTHHFAPRSYYSKKTLRHFNLSPLIRFYWFYNYTLPVYLFLSLVTFDYEATISIWNIKLWDSRSYIWVRGMFCKSGTSESTCNIPDSVWEQVRRSEE